MCLKRGLRVPETYKPKVQTTVNKMTSQYLCSLCEVKSIRSSFFETTAVLETLTASIGRLFRTLTEFNIVCLRYMTQISRGADIERKDINDMSALMWAAAEGHTSVGKVLLKAGQSLCDSFSYLTAAMILLNIVSK